MRCPKCHYLSFEPEPRCRNCGFALALDDSDLPIKSSAPADDTLLDLTFRSATDPDLPVKGEPVEVAVSAAAPGGSTPDAPHSTSAARRVDRPAARPPVPGGAPARSRGAAVQTPPSPTTELPLFVKGLPTDAEDRPAANTGTGGHTNAAVRSGDALGSEPAASDSQDIPLVPMTAQPRRPLGVRRKAGDGGGHGRHSGGTSLTRKLGPLDRDLLEDLQRIERLEQRDPPASSAAAGAAFDRVGGAKRAAAAAVDAVFMGGLAAAVLGVTLRWCDVPWARVNTLPVAPITAFVLLVGVGYLLMFTAAGGQTIGKMIVGLRVVGDRNGDVSVKQAFYRSLLTVPSVLAFGAGFIPALLGEERAVHDRLTHTRVVRA